MLFAFSSEALNKLVQPVARVFLSLLRPKKSDGMDLAGDQQPKLDVIHHKWTPIMNNASIGQGYWRVMFSILPRFSWKNDQPKRPNAHG